MERITTPTAVVDKFGPGKNGFQGGGPPNATQLSPEWFDNTQEEISRVIEGQGIVLDGATLDQMKQAIDDYAFADPSITGTLTIENLASIEVESGGAINVQSGGTLDTMAGSIVGLQGAVTFTPTATHTCDTVANFNKGVNLGDDVADPIAVNGTMTVNENANFIKDVIGLAAQILKYGTFELLSGSPAPSARQLAAGTSGQLVWNPGAGGEFVHYSPNGWVYATGDQEAATGLAAVQLVATTTVAVTGVGLGNVRVIVVGQAQVNSLGSTMTINVQENQTLNPAYSNIGTAEVMTTTHTQIDANAWQDFRHERVFAAGTATATLYQASIAADGGKTISVKNVRLRVVNERA